MRKINYYFISLLFLILTLPCAVYVVGLLNINGRPVVSNQIQITDEEIMSTWTKVGEVDYVYITKLSPYYYVRLLLGGSFVPGERIAWVVSRDYAASNLKSNRMIFWHISSAALTIWLTRNWSARELLQKAYEIQKLKNYASNNEFLTKCLPRRLPLTIIQKSKWQA